MSELREEQPRRLSGPDAPLTHLGRGESALFFRDDRYVDTELELDEIIEQATPEKAWAYERRLVDKIREPHQISAGLARVALKAIAISQIARQFHHEGRPLIRSISASYDDASTYRNLGALIDASLDSKRKLAYGPKECAGEFNDITGVISEAAFFSLAVYTADLARPLSGVQPASQYNRARYILPSTIDEDSGIYENRSITLRSAFDYAITYQTGDNPHRFVQVKTSDRSHKKDAYDPAIIVFPMELRNSTPVTEIAQAIVQSSRNTHFTKEDYLKLKTTTRRITRAIQ